MNTTYYIVLLNKLFSFFFLQSVISFTIIICNILLILVDEFNKDISYYSLFFILCLHIVLSFYYKIFYEPFVFSLSAFLMYMAIGGGNYLDRVYVDMWNDLYAILFYTFIILGFMLMHTIVRNNIVRIFYVNNNKIDFIFKLLIILGISGVFLNWLFLGGIPLMEGETLRFSSIPMLSTIFSLGIIAVIYLKIKTNKKIYTYTIFLYFVLAVGQAYRTNILTIVLMLFLFYGTFSNLSFKRKNLLLLVFILIFTGINAIKLNRDISLYGKEGYIQKLEKEGVPKKLYIISPILRSMSEGPGIFQTIRDNLDDFGYGYGKYIIQNLSTILPGKQPGYGDIFNDMVYEPTDNTKTGTILSSLYIDWGIYGIIVGAILFGIIIRFHFPIKQSASYIIIYLLVVSTFIIYIHNGYIFQPSSLIMYFALLLIYISQKLKV